MADFLNNGQLGQLPIEQWFFETPPCTRYWTTATVITSILVQCKFINPFQLFYTFRAVYYKSQYWRLLTTFVYLGPPSLDLVFHVFFMTRYSRLLESSSSSTATFSWLLLYATTALLLLTSLPWISYFQIGFLGTSLSSTLVYIWSRRNPETRLSLMGLMVFTAPYLPWVLMGFSLFMHGQIPKDEILGVCVGHVYYFLADVWPGIYQGSRPMDPPAWWIRLWDGQQRGAGTGARGVEGDVQAAVAAAGGGGMRPG
ncbi:Derlin-2.2 [Cyphellophora attinorum]|uniref:Derlin n=1 Tax=Cyphellophora attinorum TaxID=1664694 RepID=A0A0N1HJT9_9EURO|nr:Derlin-2.2 [Phialophora attinorum]KPI34303.1 Derlin-2.2 [Phialophora attinorum]